jgi:uncharacterized repeat protein (TIGR01451 family)
MRARVRFCSTMIAAVLLVAAAAETAAAQSPTSNWPNSPVRHRISDPAPPTEPSFTTNLRGSFAIAGNTLLTCPANSAAALRRAKTRRARVGAETCINDSNNGLNMRYVNVDPGATDPNTNRPFFNSSSATLAMPSDARVVRAYLYWGADLAPGVEQTDTAAAPGGKDPSTNPYWKKALMRVGAGSYATADATVGDGKWAGVPSWYSQPGNRPGFAYQARADVTPQVTRGFRATQRRTRAGDSLLTVTVADVQAGYGNNRHAGWTLLVMWENDTAAFRNLTLFDGFDFVQVKGDEQLVVGPLNFTGFRTPASGTVNAHAIVWAYEGDRGITGDYLALGRLGTACPQLPHMSDGVNPIANFFNSTISANGNNVTGRSPGWNNQLGFDLDNLSVPEGTIPNNATGASVCLGTVGDTYFFGGVAFETLIRAPNAKIDKSVTPTTANPGDVVTYTTTLSNPQRTPTPTAALTNAVIDDPLSSGLDFVDFVPNSNGSVPPCNYDAAKRAIHCDVGRVEVDASFSYSYRARVNAAAQGTSPASLPNVACYRANSEDQGDVKFTGCDPASVVVPPNPYVDLGVVKTVSADTISPGGTLTWTLVATNHGPGTSTNFTLADALPAGVTFVSLTRDPALTCTPPAVGATGTVTCTAPSVAAGRSMTVTITGTVPASTANGTVLTNVTTVHGNEPEPTPDPHPNRDAAQTRVDNGQPLPPPPPPEPDPSGPVAPPVPASALSVLSDRVAGTRLSLSKQVTGARIAAAGDTVSFRLRVRNAGEAGALNVRVCDVLPRGLTLASAPRFRAVGRAMCVRVGHLRVGEARSYRVTARVSRGARRFMRNVATARAANAPRVIARASVGTPSALFTG